MIQPKRYIYTALLLTTVSIVFIVPAIAQPAPQNEATTVQISQGDAKKGRKLFNQCKGCHTFSKKGGKRLGPNLHGLFGRQVGTRKGYTYSKALQDAGFVWTETELNAWLSAPKSYLPGNKMAFSGLKTEQMRQDLMAYLHQATK